MFDRFTARALRVIFFARYEASEFGSPTIETEHLLLGILREDKALANRFLPSNHSVASIRRRIRALTPLRDKISTSVDLPLSHEGGAEPPRGAGAEPGRSSAGWSAVPPIHIDRERS